MKTIITLIIFVCFCISAKALNNTHHHNSGKNVTKIKLQFVETTSEDTLVLYQSLSGPFTNLYTNGNFKEYKAARERGGWFSFTLNNSNSYSYILVSKLKKFANRNALSDGANLTDIEYEILPYYIVKPGDDIIIKIHPKTKIIREGYQDFNFDFSGTGSLKYRLRHGVDSIAYNFNFTPLVNADLSYNPDNFENQKIKACIALIEQNKKNLTVDAYYALIDYAINNEHAKQQEAVLLMYLKPKKLYDLDSLNKEEFVKAYNNLDWIKSCHIPLKILLFSRDFLDAELGKQEIVSYVRYGHLFYDSLYSGIKNNYSGEFRDKLLTYYFKKYQKKLKDHDRLLSDAISIIKSPKYSDEIRKLTVTMSGKPAYNFDLSDINGKRVRLTDFKGKIIFIDFWYTGCENCVIFYQNELSKAEENLKNNPDVVFMTISIDKDRKFWTNSVHSGKYTSTNVVNLFTNGNGMNDEIIKHYQINLFPQPMIIDENQKIHRFSSDLRNANDIEQAIKSLRNNN